MEPGSNLQPNEARVGRQPSVTSTEGRKPPNLHLTNPEGIHGDKSPDSASLYSDEIPSGYNSGEQYDTLSTGYMSGEAYELPETRLELHEPALDVIDECIQPLGSNAVSDDNIFVFPLGPGFKSNLEKKDDAESLSSTSSSDTAHANTVEANVHHESGLPVARSPNYVGSVKNKIRKKMASLSIPMDNSPLGKLDYDEQDIESSDFGPGADAATGGYRVVPSDTDTSAFDSDANALISGATDSGNELHHASIRNNSKGARLAARKAKKIRKHDEQWFDANDNKYWAVTRIICFWGSILCMLTSFVVAGILIYHMPRQCDPITEWYQGNVLLDVKPEFSSTGNVYRMEIGQIVDRLSSIKSQGIRGIHLKRLMADPKGKQDTFLPTADFRKVYESVLGPERSIQELVNAVHDANLTLMVEIPVVGSLNETDKGALTLDLEHAVSKNIQFWSQLGTDGIYLKGLEHFGTDAWVAQSVQNWRMILDKFGNSHGKRVLMTSYKFAHNIYEHNNEGAKEALQNIELLDATINIEESNLAELTQEVAKIAEWDAIEGRPWINWNMRFLQNLHLNHAALAFQLLLPGTISVSNHLNDTLSNQTLKNLTAIRTLAVPIYMNGNYKRCECKEGTTKETNFILRDPFGDVLQLERFYNRRHRFVLVANFGDEEASLESVGKVYSVGQIAMDTSGTHLTNEDVSIRTISLAPGHALLFKLQK